MSFFTFSGCSSTGQPVLGEKLSFTPGWDGLKQTAKQAVLDPNVWATLLGGLLLQINDLDQKFSDELRESTPLFGSNNNAEQVSDDLKSLTELGYITTALVAPGPDTSSDWVALKARLLGVEWLAIKTARSFTSAVKTISQRERPNNQNDRSFPSGHATSASIQANMAKLNIDYLPLEKFPKQALGLTFDSFAALTAWARVEAGMHYPSDVLAGWAIGHFFSHLANGFINPEQQALQLTSNITNRSGEIRLAIRF